MASEKKLSSKTLKHVFNRHYQLLGCFNYERQMSTGYAWTMMPALRELYQDNPDEMKKAVKRHLEFFNCATTPSPFIIGISCAMEEQNASAEAGTYDESSITAVKAALMGPLAGIGDSFFWGTFRVIGAGVGAPLAVAGNFLGPILYFLINVIPSEFVRRFGFKIGYEGGSTFLTRISEDGTLQKMTEAARIMGLIVIGAMIPSMVTLNLAATLNINGAEVVLQQIVDQICPQILPLLLVFACYKLLKKRVSGTVIMIGLLVFGVIPVALGIL
ncbi:MAG: PTS system mannose/fructose/sorbose family transporter subunit IID [Clostridium sp.]|nr:PTS system mannose/fructose/sorbose family transporter subunit IID [Clostridium sp.]